MITVSCLCVKRHPALSPPVWTHWSHYSESDREKTKPADSYWHTRTVRYLHTCFQYYKTTCSQTEPKQYQRDKHIVFHRASLFNKTTTTIIRADFWTSLGVYVIMHMWCAFQIETKWVYLKATHWIQIHIFTSIHLKKKKMRGEERKNKQHRGCGWNKYRGIIS